MLRVTLIEIFLVSLPFLLFIAYRTVVGARRRAAGGAAVDEGPYQLLFFSGAALSLIALVIVVLLGQREPVARDELIYVPPHNVDGRIVPGEFITPEEAARRGLAGAEPAEAPDEGGTEGGG